MAFDQHLQEVSRNIREAFIVSRIHELPENVIDLLAWQWHVDFYEPELQTEPHTFSVRGCYKDDHVNVDFLGEDADGILTQIIELTKPARSRLLKLLVAPIPIDMTKHVCRWD